MEKRKEFYVPETKVRVTVDFDSHEATYVIPREVRAITMMKLIHFLLRSVLYPPPDLPQPTRCESDLLAIAIENVRQVIVVLPKHRSEEADVDEKGS